jgi:hypothetical protein
LRGRHGGERLAGAGFGGVEHIGPSFAEDAHETLDFDEGELVFADVGLEETAEVVVVETVEVCGDLSAGLKVQIGAELGDDGLGAKESRIYNFDTARGLLG